jgi:hypothetical protein
MILGYSSIVLAQKGAVCSTSQDKDTSIQAEKRQEKRQYVPLLD